MEAGLIKRRRLRLEIGGLVQGVGFRPHCHRLAQELGLGGWVRNGPGGVELELEGETSPLERFVARLTQEPLAHSHLERLERRWQEPLGETGFAIRPSPPDSGTPGARGARVPPDLAPCPACVAELFDATNRRHGYPFISCCSCGPRHSLVLGLPFERECTTLVAFPLCAACQREYGDPGDRRFHAQTIGCPHCGPRLRWHPQPAGATPVQPDPRVNAVAQAVAALRQGQIVALKGLGGFQLLVDAGSETAVGELRRRKGRPAKPLAVMVADLAAARALVPLAPGEGEALTSAVAPIVLLRCPDPPGGIAESVAPGMPGLGVMLPSTPLHHLLLRAFGGPLVATSGNRSGEPLCFEEDDALERLGAIADGFLLHDRPIAHPLDDSVLQVVKGEPLVLRQARGLAPLAVDLDPLLPAGLALDGVLALGGQLKSSVALGRGRQALLSVAVGDLGTEAGEGRLRRTIERWQRLEGVSATRLVCDQHRGYVSHRIAHELAAHQASAAPLEVQHHHAHLLAVMAEHGLAAPRLGVAWDGAGQGDDHTLWGGELLRVGSDGWQRLARLRPFPLPGGERALREPRRAACGLLFAAYGAGGLERLGLDPAAGFNADERSVLAAMLGRGALSPLCSSIGRLFDAVAALLGLCPINRFEAEAALRLEAAAWRWRDRWSGSPPAPQTGGFRLQACSSGVPLELDWAPLLERLLEQRDGGEPIEAIAHGFHLDLGQVLVDLAQRLGARELLLAGGCFQNRLLVELAELALGRAGIRVVRPVRLPCNDGALAVGQLLAAAMKGDATLGCLSSQTPQ
ncbi:MAG: carbamoyltransferase HypF [Synechococcaceae cyanobacterium ELA445]